MDGEWALQNAFTDVFPGLETLRWHNHFYKDIKKCLRENLNRLHQGVTNRAQEPSPAITVTTTPFVLPELITNQLPSSNESPNDLYRRLKDLFVKQHLDDVCNLLRGVTKIEFMNEYQKKKVEWAPAFTAYWERWHLSHIDCFGTWTNRPYGLFDEISGITNNPVESINAVLKKWISWKQLTTDKLVQMLYLFLGYYCNEIKRGLS
ncbi:unnamed protein product [Didymodactylos carnosus]|uniref:Uncharacterized protein n=1 Tax=Didymodactylos carnosus TaxID=1234261 RepID=A0A815F3B5_9BILA|nr:unnamed protein product [Didymodactylos carnosus]CAF1320701.1 unnamed protein product [Didymodactylos carnosus]CAF3718384.1 unnamed protein product [Didymodactylos carnosus]CAF4166161.1 unnamed protein product [Didymodactylos carnosus]